MDPMMNTIGPDYGFITLWIVHIASVIVSFTGLLLLIVLAIKTFTAAQLKTWGIWMIVAGSVACLITIALLGRPWVSHSYWGAKGGMQMQDMQRMMQMMMVHNQASPNGAHDDMQEMLEGMMGEAGNRPGMMR